MLIAQLSDLHVRPPGRVACRVVQTNTLTERALRAVSRLLPPPDMVLLTGDLAELGLPEEYAVLAQMLRRHLRMPVYWIPGNHDDREEMIAGMPGTQHESGFIHYVIDKYPVRIIMLDTAVPGGSEGELCEARLAWLECALGADPSRPTLIAMHHPPFITGIAHMDRINLQQSERFAQIVARNPQIELILCGHVHRPIMTRVAHAPTLIAPSVAQQVELDLQPDAPSYFRLEPPAYYLHRWSPDGGFVTHTAYVEDYPGPYPFVAPD